MSDAGRATIGANRGLSWEAQCPPVDDRDRITMTTLGLGDVAQENARRTAHEYVRETLRRAILSGSIRGGERLVQAELARELGVSTTPVREALRDLATEGLIDLDAHRGAVVKQLRYEELIEIQFLMRLLEPEALRLAAAEAEHGISLDRAGDVAGQMATEPDVGRWVDLNREFHELLVTPLEGTRLHGILDGLRAAAAPYIALALQQRGYRHDVANEHHLELVDAIRAGDGTRAAELARQHVDLTTETLAEAREVFESRQG